MHITSQKYRLAQLKKEHLQQSSILLAKSFLNHNKIWKGYQPTYEEVQQFMFDKTNQMLDTQNYLRKIGTLGNETFINFIYIDGADRIVGVETNYELEHYLNRLRSEVDLKHFNTLEKIGIELEKTIRKEDVVPGRNIYGMFGAVEQNLMGNGTVFSFYVDIGFYLSSKNIQVMYGRCSNIKSFVLMMKMGGQLLIKKRVIDKDHEFTLSFVRIELNLKMGQELMAKAKL